VTDIKYQSNGNVRVRLIPGNGFANYRWPTVAELNAGLAVEDAIPWDGFDFGMQASDTSTNPPLSAKSIVETRAAANYGGGIPFWYPGYFDDAGNLLSNTFDFFNPDEAGYERVQCFVAVSIDGEIGETSQPASTMEFANGDFVSIYKVTADAWDDSGTVGDDEFFYAINFLRNGGVAHYTVASTAAPVLVIPATLASTEGDIDLLAATVNGRPYNGGVTWTTSDSDVATVSDYGVVTSIAAGTADVVGTLRYSTGPVTDTTEVTVSA
jgi:hypothetical protein